MHIIIYIKTLRIHILVYFLKNGISNILKKESQILDFSYRGFNNDGTNVNLTRLKF